MDKAGDTREFEFQNDNNGLAADHVAQCATHRAMTKMTWAPKQLTGEVTRAWFRRHYADRWIEVDLTGWLRA